MTQIYLTKIVTDFSAAHQIRGYDGPCARLHGHNWKIEIAVKATQLNDIGIGIDFNDIKKAANQLLDTVDHQFLNEIPPFTEINPTAENIARWIYQELSQNLNTPTLTVDSITLFETDRSSVCYREEIS